MASLYTCPVYRVMGLVLNCVRRYGFNEIGAVKLSAATAASDPICHAGALICILGMQETRARRGRDSAAHSAAPRRPAPLWATRHGTSPAYRASVPTYTNLINQFHPSIHDTFSPLKDIVLSQFLLY